MFKKENLRKNFLRVKQIADQNLGRVEKTEVISDDLQSSEKKVELVKHVSSKTISKLATSLISSTTNDPEKKLKKMPQAGLGHSMIECASYLGMECIMGQLYQSCGECQNSLAQKHLQYEIDVDRTVLEPLQAIIETEIPPISKLKKALSKVTLDMDSAKSRYNNAVRQTQVPGVNMVSASAKVDTVKDELEDTISRVELAKDAYTIGMFNFISKEAEHSQNLLNLLEAQANYHRQALDVIENVIPKMRESLSCNPTKPVYGASLEEHLRVTNRDIAQVLEACVCFLIESGLDEEGLFRIAGMASKVKKLKASFDAGIDFDDIGELDPHTVAGAFKQYLRELPEPLLTFNLFTDFMAAAQQTADQRLQALWCVVDRLPKPNYDNFRYLIKFLSKLTQKSDVNKMTPGNIAIVIGPNLIWSEGDSGPNMMNTGILSLITELIVQHAEWFFPGAQDFQATQRDRAPDHKRQVSGVVIQKPGTSVVATKEAVTTMSSELSGSRSSVMVGSQSGSQSENTGLAALSSTSGPISGQKTSEDSVSSSSESTSLSDISLPTKEYENAATLERRGSVDQYLTARGDLSQTATFPTRRLSLASKRTNPIITFDPKERLKQRSSTKKQAPIPKPRTVSKPSNLQQSIPESPTTQNVHAEMYSTAFALQALDDSGMWPKYLNTVRSIWDDQLHNTGNSDLCIVGNNSGKGQARSNEDINFGCGSPAGNGSPPMNKITEVQENHLVERTGSTKSGSSQGTPQSSPAAIRETANPFVQPGTPPPTNSKSHQATPVTPPTASRSPSVSPAVSNSNLPGAPLAERIEQVRGSIKRRPSVPPPVPPKR